MRALVIQTAFIGDVVLASATVESLHSAGFEVHIMVRKGNEQLFADHPFIRHLHVWDKRQKIISLLSNLRYVRSIGFDVVINLQRYGTTALFTLASGARIKAGFRTTIASRLYTHSILYSAATPEHEVERNYRLLSSAVQADAKPPRLYPSAADYEAIAPYTHQPYVCIAPTSVWYTKQLPMEQWHDVIRALNTKVYLLGSDADSPVCDQLAAMAGSQTTNLAGKLSLLESAALISRASCTIANDSAVTHIASAMNAPIVTIFCSTIPEFGFGPLSSLAAIVQTTQTLSCRPCGIHGLAQCPEKHFLCARSIGTNQILSAVNSISTLRGM